MFLNTKKRWTLVAALFVIVAVLFAWENGFLPFEPRQPNVVEQTAPEQAEADKPASGQAAAERRRAAPTV